jgi:hypothetical protein
MDCDGEGGPDEASEPAGSSGTAIAVTAVLICAVLLMVCPAVIAAISMVDPGALGGASRWIQRESPTISYLDYAKVTLTLIAPIVIWRVEAGRARESRVGLERLESDLAERGARGLLATTD